MKYVVTIGERRVDVGIDGELVSVNGRTMRAHATPVTGTPLWRLELDGRTLTLPLMRDVAGEWSAIVQGGAVAIEALDERTRYIRSLAAAGKGPAGPGNIKAPMPGLVVRVLVEAGQTVRAGQGVLVLEAMKMENELKAPAAGVVSVIRAEPGQAVEKGQVLVEFAAEAATG